MRDAIVAVAERPAGRLPAAAGSSRLRTLVIAGNGMVGHRLCRELVSLGVTAVRDVTVFGEEPRPAYDRVHLTDYLSGRNEDDLLLSPIGWYRDHGIDLRLGDPIVDIDRRARTVRSASGAEIEYTDLVLATGSAPYVPPVEGTHLAGVFVYRTVEDLEAIRARARQASTAAVIGAGLLGLEAARALQHLALQVTVIESAAAVMPSQLDQRAGQALGRQIAALGIDVRTATLTKRIESSGRRRTLRLASGGQITVDLVVIAAGIRPRTELARQCGLALSPDGGVSVDDHLRTSDPHIFAIGECASHGSQIHGLAAPGYAMADTLARNIAGADTAFSPPPAATRLKLLGVEVATAGEPLDRGFAVRAHTRAGYRLLRVDRGRLVGALGVGRWDEFARVHEAVGRRTRVWPWQIARFERTGTLWRSRRDIPVTEWAADAIVCNCMSVTRGRLDAAGAGRTVTVQSLIDCTGASTLCGSCRPLLEELACAGPREPARISRGLLGWSLVALAAAVALWAATPVPFALSIEGGWHVDALWRTGTYRQTSGFTLLGLALAASLLTARKRWRRAASTGTFATWRLAHAAIGVATLAVLLAHTGARPGEHLNLALMTSFSALNVLGGIAGGLTAVERTLGAAAGRKYRSVMVMAHTLATWPLPVLVAFHVLSVYYF